MFFKRKKMKSSSNMQIFHENMENIDDVQSQSIPAPPQSLGCDENDDNYEGETTLLTADMEQYSISSEMVARSIGYTDEEDDNYEGETTLLTADMTQYTIAKSVQPVMPIQTSMHGLQFAEQSIEDQGDDEDEYEGATTVLSPIGQNQSVPQGIYIPASAPKAQLLRIVKSEKIDISKIKFVIGQASDSDYIVPNNSVSRKHAFIIFKDNKYYLVDNRSTNKTYVDGEMLEPSSPKELYHGALIQFSDELYQFMLK